MRGRVGALAIVLAGCGLDGGPALAAGAGGPHLRWSGPRRVHAGRIANWTISGLAAPGATGVATFASNAACAPTIALEWQAADETGNWQVSAGTAFRHRESGQPNRRETIHLCAYVYSATPWDDYTSSAASTVQFARFSYRVRGHAAPATGVGI